MTDDDTIHSLEGIGDESNFTTHRRRFLQAAGAGAAGLTGLGGLGAAQSNGDNTIVLEAVEIATGGSAGGRSEYAWEDGTGGVVRGPPEAVCDAQGGNHVWMGVAPDSIADMVNPTLELTAGETYTIEITNDDGQTHDFVIVDGDGNEVLSEEVPDTEGETASFSFEATAEMAEYYCSTHSTSQRGSIQVSGAPDEVNLLVISITTGWTHRNIPYGIQRFKEIEDQIAEGIGVDTVNVDTIPEDPPDDYEDAPITDAPDSFSDVDFWMQYDAVIWFNTTGNVLAEQDERDAFRQYMENGGGYVGIHSAADTHRGAQDPPDDEWQFYIDMLGGATFVDHPFGDEGQYQIQEAEVQVSDRVHPSTDHLPARWSVEDEWYNYAENPRGDVHVLATLDESTYNLGNTEGMGADHPIAWAQEYAGGRAWYTGRGHTEAAFDEEAYIDHVIGGIGWATGHLEGEASGTVWDAYERERLTDPLCEPMKVDTTPEGYVFFTERPNGEVHVYDPESGTTELAATLDVYSGQEDGLQGIAFPPDFEDSGMVYMYYAPAGDESVNRLSRFAVDLAPIGDDGNDDPIIDLSTEEQILDVDTQRQTCCHVGGDIAFGPMDDAGNYDLYLSTGDDTNPFNSSGFAPIDERDGEWTAEETGDPDAGRVGLDHRYWDAQRTAANTNDLRGSILRIRPLPDEADYEIPDGNLFTGDEYDGEPVREEIYVMGCRNPFTIEFDEVSGDLFYADYGPDAGSWTDAEGVVRGPPGIVEFNRVTEPGFHGWPYFTGPNIPYMDGDFVAADTDDGQAFEPSEPFDPQNPVNDSPNNDGLTELPPAQPASIYYPRSWDQLLNNTPSYAEDVVPDENPWPELPTGGAPMAGPIYRSGQNDGSNALPEYFDGKWLIMEWGSNWIKYVSFDGDGEAMDIEPLMPFREPAAPMDMTVAPDGSLYSLEYGGGFFTCNVPESGLYRIDHNEVEGLVDDAVSLELGETTLQAGGDPMTSSAAVTIANYADTAMSSIAVSLSTDDQLDLTAPDQTTFDSLAAFEEMTAEGWSVSAPSGATAGTYDVTAEVSYEQNGESTTLTAMASLTVEAPDEPETISVPYGVNLGGSPPEDSNATVPVVIDGLEFTPISGPDDFDLVTVTGDTPPGDPDWFTPPAQAGSPTTDDIANTEYDALYQTELIGYNMGFEIPIEDGTYDVTLHSAEIYFGGNGNGGGTGSRVFDISVEGEQLVEGLDLYEQAGHDVAWTMTAENVEVTDGTLNISTTTQTDFSKLGAIEIREADGNGGDGATVQVVTDDELGDILADGDGNVLYMWDNDTQGSGESACTGGCTDNWPPLTAADGVTAGGSVTADLTTFERSDGSMQVAANGWPLYYYVGDENPGDTNGQGVGDVWWVLDPSGMPVLPDQPGLDPSVTIELDANASTWTGTAPSSIEGTTNPTLTLREGETYTVEWTNLLGIGHNFEILDANSPTADVVNGISSDIMNTEGETQTIEFEATAEMARYQCFPHRGTMYGSIEIV